MPELFLFIFIASLGMLVQSFAGFAGSLFAIPLFAFFMSPREAVPAYNIIMILVDLVLVYEARKHIMWPRIGRMSIGGVVGIPLGAYCLAYLPVQYIKLGISIATLCFGLLFLLNIRFQIKETFYTQSCCGLISGFMGGAISESGPPVVLMGLSCGWEKDVFRATLLAYFMILAACATLSYYMLGMITPATLKLSLVAAAPVTLISFLGVVIKNQVAQHSFQKIILLVIIVVGLIGLAHFFIGDM